MYELTSSRTVMLNWPDRNAFSLLPPSASGATALAMHASAYWLYSSLRWYRMRISSR